MADEQEKAEMAAPDGEMPEGDNTSNDAPKGNEAIQAELEDIRAALKKANAEAAKYRKAASAYEEAEEKRKEAELSEIERLQKQLEKAQAEAAALQRETLQRRVASEMGLPEPLALRLKGETVEEMKEDAQSILDAMPTPQKPKVQPTNPANGQPPQETLSARRSRIYAGGQSAPDAFDPSTATQHGGGVIWQGSKET